MNNPTKTGACLVGGGAIIGGGIAVEKFLTAEKAEEETYAPAPSVPQAPVVDEGKTVEQTLREMKLTLATQKSEFQKIYNDVKHFGFFSWASQIMKDEYEITNTTTIDVPERMMQRCKNQMNRKISEFGNLRGDKFKTLKIVCTTNYSLIDNARDYWGDEKSIFETEKKLDESKWKKQFEEFKKVEGVNKTIDDMRNKCLVIGKEPYS